MNRRLDILITVITIYISVYIRDGCYGMIGWVYIIHAYISIYISMGVKVLVILSKHPAFVALQQSHNSRLVLRLLISIILTISMFIIVLLHCL